MHAEITSDIMLTGRFLKRDKCLKVAEEHLRDGKSVVVGTLLPIAQQSAQPSTQID